MKELLSWCKENDIKISREQLEQFELYKENLLDWNQRINLTAITDYTGIWQKHFADCLCLLPLLPKGRIRLIDVGSGAGFPGIPIKIMRPDIEVTLLDSLRKRVNFLEDTICRLSLDGISCIHARAEDLAKQPEHGHSYDICTARAVARLDKLCKWCLPFLKPNAGLFLAMKGPNVEDEIEETKSAIAKLDGKIADIMYREIVVGMVHSVVICYNEGTRDTQW